MGEKAGIWLRVSTKKQDEGNQLPEVMAWIASHGYDVAAEAQYIVHGMSAFKGNKKFDAKWSEVIDDIRAGKITVLVTWKQDRLDRKLETFQMLKQVVEAGGRVEFVTQPHLNDLTTMGGRIALKVHEEIAHQESKDKSDRVNIAIAAIRENGALGGRPPFGYDSEGAKYNRRLVPNEMGLTYVPEVFTRCIAGDSLVTIAKWLDSEGVRTARGGKWSATTLREMLTNPVYMGFGTNEEGRTIYRCPELVDAAIFRAAGEALSSRPKRGPVLAENRAMLATVLFCPECQDTPERLANPSPMYRIKSPKRRGQYAYYYRCAGRGAQRKGCGNMVHLEQTDMAVDRVMCNEKIGALEMMEPHFVPGHDHSAELEKLRFEMRQLSLRELPWEEEDAERARLRAEYDQISGLPAEPDRVELVSTGFTYGDVWATLPMTKRAGWLKEVGFRVFANKEEVRVTLPEHSRSEAR